MSQRQRDFWSFSFTFTFPSVGFCPSSFFALLERLRVDVFFFRVEAPFFSTFPADRDVALVRVCACSFPAAFGSALSFSIRAVTLVRRHYGLALARSRCHASCGAPSLLAGRLEPELPLSALCLCLARAAAGSKASLRAAWSAILTRSCGASWFFSTARRREPRTLASTCCTLCNYRCCGPDGML